jgi:hypothetical protein
MRVKKKANLDTLYNMTNKKAAWFFKCSVIILSCLAVNCLAINGQLPEFAKGNGRKAQNDNCQPIAAGQ